MSDSSSRVLRFAVTSVLLAGTTGCPSDKPDPNRPVIVNPAPPIASPSQTPAATPVKLKLDPVDVNPGPPEVEPEPPEPIKTNPGPPK